MTSSEVTNNQAIILECAKAFRYDANNLMLQLSKEYNFKITSTNTFPVHIFRHKYNNKGVLKNEWTYYFHGAECRFDNINTGQIVEFIITNKPEFGFLDGYFFFNYITTTEKYLKLGQWFENYMNVWDAIDILAEKNILKRILTANSQRNIIAL